MNISIQAIGIIASLVVTIGGMIWKMAILHNQCALNKDALVRAHERIDKLEAAQTHKIEELTVQVQAIRELQIRAEEKLNLILKMEKKYHEK